MTEILLYAVGMAELGSVLEIATLLPIRFVRSALRKVFTHQPRRYITSNHCHKEAPTTEIT